MPHPSLLLAACAAALVAAPLAAARPIHPHRHDQAAALPHMTTVTVHRGTGFAGEPRYAEAGAPWLSDADAGPIGYWEANYGREDDAAIFAARYGCARPIWDSASNHYVSACN